MGFVPAPFVTVSPSHCSAHSDYVQKGTTPIIFSGLCSLGAPTLHTAQEIPALLSLPNFAFHTETVHVKTLLRGRQELRLPYLVKLPIMQVLGILPLT